MIRTPATVRSTINNPSTISNEPFAEDVLAKLGEFAAEMGITMNEALRHLIESEACRPTQQGPIPKSITSKQRTVIEHLKNGLSVKEIAHHMKVSEQTVRTHILRARCRLDCPDLLSLRFKS